MARAERLTPQALCSHLDPARFRFETTAELDAAIIRGLIEAVDCAVLLR